jgi:ribosome biogenesis GTPase
VRQAAGRKTKPQVIGTNLDTVFVVTSMNQEFNPRRLERYLTTIEKSGARPVILLNKADLADEPAAFVAEAMGVASGVEVVALSAISEVSVVEKLSRWLGVGQTVAFVGSSGVGKSTIINALLGRQTQRVADIREDDDEGRHTTTHRQLFELPGHGLLLDTPGMRELQLWGDEDDIEEAFPDVEEFASGCRFADCKHEREPGCAVMAAVASGELSAGRVDAWKKLRAELALQAQKTDVAAQIRERQKARNTGAAHKRDYKLIRAKKGDV